MDKKRIRHCYLQILKLSRYIPHTHDVITHSSHPSELHGWELYDKSARKGLIRCGKLLINGLNKILNLFILLDWTTDTSRYLGLYEHNRLTVRSLSLLIKIHNIWLAGFNNTSWFIFPNTSWFTQLDLYYNFTIKLSLWP